MRFGLRFTETDHETGMRGSFFGKTKNLYHVPHMPSCHLCLEVTDLQFTQTTMRLGRGGVTRRAGANLCVMKLALVENQSRAAVCFLFSNT